MDFTLLVVLSPTIPEQETCFVLFRCYTAQQACKYFKRLLFMPPEDKVGGISMRIRSSNKRAFCYAAVSAAAVKCCSLNVSVGLIQLKMQIWTALHFWTSLNNELHFFFKHIYWDLNFPLTVNNIRFIMCRLQKKLGWRVKVEGTNTTSDCTSSTSGKKTRWKLQTFPLQLRQICFF